MLQQQALSAQSSPWLSGSNDQQRIAMLEERIFAQDKLLSHQLLSQHQRLQHLETRVLDLESKLEQKSIGSATDTSTDITNATDSSHVQSCLLRVQSLEDQVKLSEKRLQDFESVRITEELPKVILRVNSVELSQKSLEEKVFDQNGRHPDAALSLSQTNASLPAMTFQNTRATQNTVSWAQELKEAPEYILQPSVWDVCLFSFTPELGLAGSLFSALLIAINAVSQAFILAVFHCNFLTSDMINQEDEVQAANAFRQVMSHDSRFVDLHMQRSLGGRICDRNVHDLHLEMGQFQREALNNVDGFLKDDDSTIGGFFNGQIMSLLAMFFWTSIVLGELLLIFNFAQGTFLLPRIAGEDTGLAINVSIDNSRQLYWQNVTLRRTIAVLLSLGVRMAIALYLLYAGCLWLATTADIRELLLNAVALEFILSFDEIIYQTFSGSHTRALLESFAPLKIPHSTYIAGFELKKVALLLCIPVSALSFYFVYTMQMVEHMRTLKAVLCDPPLDFTYGIDALKFVHLQARESVLQSEVIASAAVQEALGRNVFTNLTNLTRSFDRTQMAMSVAEATSLSHGQLVDLYNKHCVDILDVLEDVDLDKDPSVEIIWIHFHEIFEVSNCLELENRCMDYDSWYGMMARAFCPVTCGCDKVESRLPATSLHLGCPTSCFRSNAYQEYLASASCVNPTVGELNATTYWPQWMQYLLARHEIGLQELGLAMSRYGCDFHKHLRAFAGAFRESVCTGRTAMGLKPIAAICPQTCNCEEVSSPLCAYGPTSDWCRCVPSFKSLLQNLTDVNAHLQCWRRICNDPWADAEPFITSRYEELWHLEQDNVPHICSRGTGE